MADDQISRRNAMGGILAGMALSGAAAATNSALAADEPAIASSAKTSRASKITLEEHFLFPGAESVTFHPIGLAPGMWERIDAKLLDVESHRLPEMDANGIAMQVVSLTANGIQGEPNRRKAVDMAKAANDWVVEKYLHPYPKRFGGFAAVALQDPAQAVKETERAVKQLGFCGVMVNGYTNIGDENTGEYLDLPKFAPFWECTQDLDIPVYLHPRLPLPSQRLIYRGHDELLNATWAFNAETSVHALRLITSGVFDRYPRQQLILGHGGEGLVAMMARVQRRFEYTPCGKVLKKPVSQYMRDNFYITTSGNFHTPTMDNCITEVGIDRVMFSVDYPYENMAEGCTWFDTCPLQGEARDKVARLNAQRLLKLTPA